MTVRPSRCSVTAEVIEADLTAERYGETQRGAEWQSRARHAWLQRKREVRLCRAEIAGRKIECRSNKCKSASKWDPVGTDANAVMLLLKFVQGGVPCGADQDPIGIAIS